MNRKIRYGLRIIYNVFRMLFIKLFSFGKIKGKWIQLLSPKCRLLAEKGKFFLTGRVMAESNTLINAVFGI